MEPRRFFNDSDGTNFWQDLSAVFANAKSAIANFFQSFFDTLDKWYEPLGLPVVSFLEGMKNIIASGSFSGSLFDAIVKQTSFPYDDITLAWLRKNLPEIIARWQGLPNTFDTVEGALISVLNRQINTPELQRGDQLRGLGSEIALSMAADNNIEDKNLRHRRDFDLLVQGSYNLMKSQV